MSIHEAIEKTRRVIKARLDGRFDDAELKTYGPLGTDTQEDIRFLIGCVTTQVLTQQLRIMGFVVGDRDVRLNTDHPGRFMVAEDYEASETPTKDGSNGPWCIVGDNLHKLCVEAFLVWDGER